MTPRPARRGLVFPGLCSAAAALALAGCAETSGGGPIGAAPLSGASGPSGPGRAQLYAEEAAAGRQAAAEGRLKEAAWRLRVAEALSSDRAAAAREADAAVARMEEAAAADEAEGDAAAKAGRSVEARAAYEKALQLDPRRPHARSYMREQVALETEREVVRQGGSTPHRATRGKARLRGARGKRPAS